jgi:hypothetical protein
MEAQASHTERTDMKVEIIRTTPPPQPPPQVEKVIIELSLSEAEAVYQAMTDRMANLRYSKASFDYCVCLEMQAHLACVVR